MKRFFSILFVLMFLLSACAFAETASPAEPLKEGEMYFHGYKNSNTGYYVGVPAEWALIGMDSTGANLDHAYEVMGYSEVKALTEQLSKENDILFTVSSSGDQMVLTYGLSDGITTDRLAEDIDDFKAMLAKSCTGIEFKEDCGLITVNELTQVMYIGAKYKSHDVSQYFLAAGSNVYVFTFTDVEKDIEQAVLSTFSIVN
ncbi:MAG: hypothetical protein IJD86_05000 [Clostridia bacterium]|nr:hypothetical protein [Clostridia bacterium]